MSWVGYLVVGISALLIGHTVWIRLAASRLRGSTVTDLAADFPALADSGGRAVVYCYGGHCPACRQMAPTVDELRDRHPNLYKLDVAANPATARRLGIRAIPTTVMIENGTVQGVILGASAAGPIERFLARDSAPA